MGCVLLMGNNFHKLVNVSPNPARKTDGIQLTRIWFPPPHGQTGVIAPQPLRYVG